MELIQAEPPHSVCASLARHLSGLAAPPQARWDEPFRQHHSSTDNQKKYIYFFKNYPI